MSNSYSTLALALVWVLAGTSSAAAHAFPDQAEPRVGAVLTEPPQEVKIWFTEELEPAFSTVRVLNDTGTTVDQGNGKVAEEDPHLLQVDLLPLPHYSSRPPFTDGRSWHGAAGTNRPFAAARHYPDTLWQDMDGESHPLGNTHGNPVETEEEEAVAGKRDRSLGMLASPHTESLRPC